MMIQDLPTDEELIGGVVDAIEAGGGMPESTPMWLILLAVLVRWFWQARIFTRHDEKGPAWVSNGTMNSLIGNLVLQLKEGMREVIRDERLTEIPKRNEVMLKGLVESSRGFEGSHTHLATKLAECGGHLEKHSKSQETQTKVLRAVVRELNNTGKCPYTPSDRVGIVEEFERKRKSDAHTRAEDLGIDPEEIGK